MAFPERPEPQTSPNSSEPEILASRVDCQVLAPRRGGSACKCGVWAWPARLWDADGACLGPAWPRTLTVSLP